MSCRSIDITLIDRVVHGADQKKVVEGSLGRIITRIETEPHRLIEAWLLIREEAIIHAGFAQLPKVCPGSRRGHSSLVLFPGVHNRFWLVVFAFVVNQCRRRLFCC